DSPLRRGLDKIARLLGFEPGDVVGVDLSVLGGPTGQLLDEAVQASRMVEFRYWSYGTDEVEMRTVDPWRVFTVDGSWYLVGHDHDRDEQRRFRLDRIGEVRVRSESSTIPPPPDLELDVTFDDVPTATLDIAGSSRWVLESLAILEFEERADGRVRVTVPVAGRMWLERLAVRLGDDLEIVELDPSLGDRRVAATAARRILTRYRSADSDS